VKRFALIACILEFVFGSAADLGDFLKFANAPENETLLTDLFHRYLEGLAAEDRPLLLAIGGGPGSGKTTLRKKIQETKSNIHIHDMDEVRMRIPGFLDDAKQHGALYAFEKRWSFSRDMAEILVRFAIKQRYSILYDRTCGAEGSYEDLKEAKRRGYRVTLVGLYASAEIAIERTKLRSEYAITEEAVREYLARFSSFWPRYLSFVDEAFLYDSSQPDLRLIFSSEKGALDLRLYDQFLHEAHL
jgi:predicted ABC-type ATPase